jgi:uncharacterized protein YgiM (DUF1202 family)
LTTPLRPLKVTNSPANYLRKTPKTVKYRVNTRVLPLNGRSGPGTKFKVVAKAKKGQTLTIDKVDGGWGRTSYGHWFKMSFLKKV